VEKLATQVRGLSTLPCRSFFSRMRYVRRVVGKIGPMLVCPKSRSSFRISVEVSDVIDVQDGGIDVVEVCVVERASPLAVTSNAFASFVSRSSISKTSSLSLFKVDDDSSDVCSNRTSRISETFPLSQLTSIKTSTPSTSSCRLPRVVEGYRTSVSLTSFSTSLWRISSETVTKKSLDVATE